MADILFHPEAQEEYTAAREWYLARSVRAATRFEVEVERILHLIAERPEAFALYEDGQRYALVRRFLIALYSKRWQNQTSGSMCLPSRMEAGCQAIGSIALDHNFGDPFAKAEIEVQP